MVLGSVETEFGDLDAAIKNLEALVDTRSTRQGCAIRFFPKITIFFVRLGRTLFERARQARGESPC